ncbi:protein split ends-like [Aphis craccivora]|uniref:Protein split ends-like n=1 Tax=Aphis craccivora TaxID=307492 RepID=A0A6G0YZV7_APHCR|nr:protein split ends-like [Aphis craccivora]
MKTNGRWTAAMLLAAMWTLTWTSSAAAAAVASKTNEWRPCRAAGHRRYDEEVLRNYGDGGGGSGGSSDPGYFDIAGGGEQDDDDNDDDGGGEGETSSAEDKNTGGGGYFRFPVDDKPKRGASKPYEKKQDPYRPAASSYAVDSGNGLRVDTTLLRGETIELPTYVNVPVTLRCRFEPVDGTDDKFDTVVEAMYPGHRDAPPPPPGSHAHRILKQLMGSVDGWRGVAHNSARSVRRASGNRFGRREWPPGDDDYDTASEQRDDQTFFWNALARQRAAERMRRIHGDSRGRDVGGWPEKFLGQSARLLQRFDDRPVATRRWSENQLIEDPQEPERDVYDQQFDGGRPEQVYDLQAEPQIDDSRQVESVDDSQQIESVDDSQQIESVDDSQQAESYDESQQIESVDDSQQAESFDDSQQVESFDDRSQAEPVEDRAAVEDVDYRRVQSRSLPVAGQQLQDDMTTATSAPEIATTITSDIEKFHKGIPTRTYTEHAYTTDSTL